MSSLNFPPPPEAVVLVPARLASQRFPRKLLHPIRGKPLVLWTAERLAKELPGWPVVFAVGEEELATVLEGAGFRCVRTDPALPSGTDRLAAANTEIGARYVINVQADEPLVEGADVALLAELVRGEAEMATLATPFEREEDFRNSHRVKVVCAQDGRALYFSRSPIPYSRDGSALGGGRALLHLGLYAYRAEALARFAGLPPSPLEQIEKLEQLRALEDGFRIAVGTVARAGVGIDAPEDVPRFLALLDAAGGAGEE
ncbi:MAG: 3-deoxy-manno-octulosonate cytidylyltransferase [Opitutales bacterium]